MLRKGDWIKHPGKPEWGAGRIESVVSTEKIRVVFPNMADPSKQLVTLDLRFVGLTKADSSEIADQLKDFPGLDQMEAFRDKLAGMDLTIAKNVTTVKDDLQKRFVKCMGIASVPLKNPHPFSGYRFENDPQRRESFHQEAVYVRDSFKILVEQTSKYQATLDKMNRDLRNRDTNAPYAKRS